MKIDLHVHSTASDGKLSPKEIIDLAIKNKVKAVAITDHDSVDGLQEAMDYASRKKFEFVPGVEFSANPGELEKELHIVGLFIDPTNLELVRLIKKQNEYRSKGNEQIIQKLNSLGYQLTPKELEEEAQRKNYGRPIIAKVLMRKYPDRFKDRKRVFDELLGKNGRAFVKNQSSSLEEITRAIHAAGGIAFIAHPGYLQDPKNVIINFARIGGDGVEINCLYEHLEKAELLRKQSKETAEENSLLVSGGTDFHGEKETVTIGDCGVTLEEFERMKKYQRKKYGK